MRKGKLGTAEQSDGLDSAFADSVGPMAVKIKRERPDQRRHHRVTAPLFVRVDGHATPRDRLVPRRAADRRLPGRSAGGRRRDAVPSDAAVPGLRRLLRRQGRGRSHQCGREDVRRALHRDRRARTRTHAALHRGAGARLDVRRRGHDPAHRRAGDAGAPGARHQENSVVDAGAALAGQDGRDDGRLRRRWSDRVRLHRAARLLEFLPHGSTDRGHLRAGRDRDRPGRRAGCARRVSSPAIRSRPARSWSTSSTTSSSARSNSPTSPSRSARPSSSTSSSSRPRSSSGSRATRRSR